MMDQGYLKATAQPFQPGGGARANSNFNAPSPANGSATSRIGGPGGFMPLHMFQNHQLVGSPPRQGGMSPMHMNAQSRPFVPGMQPPLSPQLPFANAAISPIMARPIPPRVGHGMNPGSIQLTGLQTFLNAPGGMPLLSPNGQPGLMSGPASPMTLGSQAAQPFSFASARAAMGPARIGKNRKGKGLPLITPLKSTGHNSTPSVSLNPAAFAASLAAAKAKKKVAVTMPKEGPTSEDEEVLARLSDPEEGVEGSCQDEEETEEKRVESVKKRAAKDAANTRSKWTRREPLQEIDLDWRDLTPEDCINTCEIYPEPWPATLGLPDTIDIYLPGLSAWEEYQEMRLEVKMTAAEAVGAPESFAHSDSWGETPFNPYQAHGETSARSKSLSIFSPADPGMVSYKLNRYLQSQEVSEGDANLPIMEKPEKSARVGVSRFQENLPAKLKEAFAKRQAEGQEAKPRTASGHGYTMSLGMPSSGGPFGPAALSALDMIRANSEAGPAEPAMGARPQLIKGLSDTELDHNRDDRAGLAGIKEAHEEDDAPKPSTWQDLARGFGYEPEDEDEEAVKPVHDSRMEHARKHSRHASRISVSTSRCDAVEDDGDDEEDIRTNPSEDADTSDFEEELNSDAARDVDRRHWSRRVSAQVSDFGGEKRRSGEGYYDDLSNLSDADLQDSLTPSDEQYSNPSDEEAAREERMLRRQHHAAIHAARYESRRRRARSGTNNTLPSSSIGEGDLVDQLANKSWNVPQSAQRNGGEQDIISNPSDEEQSDLDDRGTFGGPLDHAGTAGARLSQDFRFPRHQLPSGSRQGEEASNSLFQYRPSHMRTMGRSTSGSMLNPSAKEFKFGGAAPAQLRRAAAQPAKASAEQAGNPYFRLPSINNSSFGSNALGDAARGHQSDHSRSNSGGLNAAAPSFTPSSFTFNAPRAPRLELPAEARSPSQTSEEATVEPLDKDKRGVQGREKRQKFGPIDVPGDMDSFDVPSSPPRPKGSTASIEGPLRDFGTLSRRGPPPFNPNGASGQRTASESRFKPDAPVFTPTWGRSTGLGGMSKRPALPDFSFGAVSETGGAESAPAPFFAFNTGNKAVPIRKPEDVEENTGNVEGFLSPQITAARAGADVPRNESDLAHFLEQESDEKEKENSRSPQSLPVQMDHLDPHCTPLASMWDRANAESRAAVSHYGLSPPMFIPGQNGDQKLMGMPIPADGVGGTARAHKHALSRESIAISLESRHHRQVQAGNFADDESLSDFIEELAERMDKALEGWAGKILDEVTIMGQVRPVHRSKLESAEREQIIEAFSHRIEKLMETYVLKAERLSGGSSVDGSFGDDSQITIKAHDVLKHKQSNGSLDAHGELDFDYVQEILDLKIQTLKDELKSTFTEALSQQQEIPATTKDAGDASDEKASSAVKLSPQVAEELATLMAARMTSALDERTRAQAQQHKQNLADVLEPTLEEHIARLQEKASADRLEVAHHVADKLQSNMEVWQQTVRDVRSSLGDQVQEALINGIIPHLETLRTEPIDADVVAARVTEILAPMISDERERNRMERRDKEERARSTPSVTADEVAGETMARLLPIVTSLKSDPVDSDALVTRLSEVIGKQSIEHMVDLTPVLALLEPIIAKQENIRSYSKKIIQQQEEVERTMSELPGAINAKTEIFLSTTGQMTDAQNSILSRVESLHQLHEQSLVNNEKLESEKQTLTSQLDESRRETAQLRAELEEARAKLTAAHEEHNAVRVEFAKLEGRLGQAEKANTEVISELESLRTRVSESVQKEAETSKKLLAAEAESHSSILAKEASLADSSLLKSHIEQLTHELTEARADRARERETAAQATAEALARAQRAEHASLETTKRFENLLTSASSSERAAQSSAQQALERAGKAEGQVAALEKRISEQDTKIANLQNLTAAQKQKAVTGQQKLAEVEKKAVGFEVKSREMEVANARLEKMGEELRGAQDAEMRLREEVSQYHLRFSELEKDLIMMKESLVGRDELEACQAELNGSREEVARLKGQLSEREKAWVQVSPVKGAWASIHAPAGQDSGADTSGSLIEHSHNFSFTSAKEVEQDDGGWWS